MYEVWIKKRGKIMRKAAAAGIILAGAILVAGGLDKESGSENFVADVQANDETTQTEEETDSDPESEEEAALAAQIDTSAPVTKGSRIAVVSTWMVSTGRHFIPVWKMRLRMSMRHTVLHPMTRSR